MLTVSVALKLMIRTFVLLCTQINILFISHVTSSVDEIFYDRSVEVAFKDTVKRNQ